MRKKHLARQTRLRGTQEENHGIDSRKNLTGEVKLKNFSFLRWPRRHDNRRKTASVGPVYDTQEKLENAALFIRLGLPSTLRKWSFSKTLQSCF